MCVKILMRIFLLLMLHVCCFGMNAIEPAWSFISDSPSTWVVLRWKTYINKGTLRGEDIVFIAPDITKFTTTSSEKTESYNKITFEFTISSELLDYHVFEIELYKNTLVKLKFSDKGFKCPQKASCIAEFSDSICTFYRYIDDISDILGSRTQSTQYGDTGYYFERMSDNSLRVTIVQFSSKRPDIKWPATQASFSEENFAIKAAKQEKPKKRHKRFFGCI